MGAYRFFGIHVFIYRTSRGAAAAGGGDRPSLWPRALRPERRATATAVAVAPATGKHFVSRNYCCAASVVAPGPTTTHTEYRIPHVNAPAVFAPLPPPPSPSPSPTIFLSRFLTSPTFSRLTNGVSCFRRPSPPSARHVKTHQTSACPMGDDIKVGHDSGTYSETL